ncbi:putative DNA recombination and repair protein RecA [Rosa chinensis]|uniref:Putative DNA recombination and repair protein RecA n=1 Tax=Rosa chinensis TaxID=74649 RepID=A0A2P6RF00_ROSCH|nr:putative DNA recombination and repair protein RecA [Rosa chinensis]
MLVDAEHAFDPAYSKALGVDVENLIVCQPDHGEMALEIADRMCRSGAIDLICVDSVSALTPRAEIEVIFFFFLLLVVLNVRYAIAHISQMTFWSFT